MIVDGSPEWHRMWVELAKLVGDVDAEYDGERWQYMGTHQGKHSFRHRAAPPDGLRKYVEIEEVAS